MKEVVQGHFTTEILMHGSDNNTISGVVSDLMKKIKKKTTAQAVHAF